jgi:hypothetical protein
MAPIVTVLVPTHNHGALLYRSVRSALAQTVEEIEVLIVGDGATAATRAAALDLASQDARVRFLDHPKGARHGEAHRHRAIAEARGDIICYLSDDDLWLPGHLAAMIACLRDADVAAALPVRVHPDESFEVLYVDLALPFYREFILSGASRIPLSCTAHTRAIYRTLPFGWRPTPETTSVTLTFWQELLRDPSTRGRTSAQPTMLKFESIDRQTWTEEERIEEMDRWVHRLATEQGRAAFQAQVLETVYRRLTLAEAARFSRADWRLRRALLAAWRRSFSWQQRERIKRLPVAGRLLTAAAEALLGPVAR